MADSMDADAALGKMPHVYQTNDFYSASADKSKDAEKENSALKDLKASLSELTTKFDDLKNAKFEAAAEPQRKTIEPSMMNLLAKKGIHLEEDKQLTVAQLDELLRPAKLDLNKRLQIKASLEQAGKIKHQSVQH
jgi:hypothetical protein